MKKILIFLAVAVALLMVSQPAMAAGFGVDLPNPLCLNGGNPVTSCPTKPGCNGTGYQDNYVPPYATFAACCGGPGTTSPSSCVTSFETLLTKITTYITGLITTLSVIIFIYAGGLYLLSAGEPAKIASANKAVIYACVGIAIALAGAGLVAVITTVIGATP